jgi:hypothetical protein
LTERKRHGKLRGMTVVLLALAFILAIVCLVVLILGIIYEDFLVSMVSASGFIVNSICVVSYSVSLSSSGLL